MGPERNILVRRLATVLLLAGLAAPYGASRAGDAHTNVAGEFRVHTILPGMAEGTPHLHYVITGTGLERRAGMVSLARQQGAGSDSAYAGLPWMLELPGAAWAYVGPDGDGGYHAKLQLYVWRVRP